MIYTNMKKNEYIVDMTDLGIFFRKIVIPSFWSHTIVQKKSINIYISILT